MKKILSVLGTAALAVALALPAAPANAQSFSFGFGAGPFGFSYGMHGGGRNWCYWHPYDCGPRYRHNFYRQRNFVDFDIDVDVPRGSGHVARCEARYRSYNWRTDMFLGFDGDYHRCRL
jgi:hypothetical protein